MSHIEHALERDRTFAAEGRHQSAEEAALRDRAIVDPAAALAIDVERMRSAAAIPPRGEVSGHVYDVVGGLVERVVPVGD